MIGKHSCHWWVPNVVGAHVKEGIEPVHFGSGRTVCKLTKLLSLAATIVNRLVEMHISFQALLPQLVLQYFHGKTVLFNFLCYI